MLAWVPWNSYTANFGGRPPRPGKVENSAVADHAAPLETFSIDGIEIPVRGDFNEAGEGDVLDGLIDDQVNTVMGSSIVPETFTPYTPSVWLHAATTLCCKVSLASSRQ